MAKNSRARGRSKALAGNVKQGVGKLIGNEQMEAEGSTEVIQGEAEEAAAKASERLAGAGQELSGTVKRAVGDLVDSPELSIEGQAEANKGKHRQEDNQ
ncbi:MAG: CsbD family protein [Roseiflexaceae bacterium]|nr:CsbD family protein [Roseiflexaceae bacterium]